RRPRRRRLRRVPQTIEARARGPVVEGLARLAALPRRHGREVAHRRVRGAGIRLRREAADRRARPRRLARPRPPVSAPPRSWLDAEAGELQRKFDEAFWCEERGGYYALALDAEKRKVDSMCSNIGHLLWSGIVPPGRVDAVVDALMGDGLWSGWGVRTMSKDDLGYNPLPAHNRTEWPPANSLLAAGLAPHRPAPGAP